MKKNILGISILLLGVAASLLMVIRKSQPDETLVYEDLKEASFYTQLGNDKVQCDLCPNRCILAPKQRGLCKVRENIKGKLYSLVYGKPVTIHVDPMEKKPMFHFLPGAKVYSLATAGCNLECKYCQNWDIAQRMPEDLASVAKTPEEVVEEAIKSGSEAIAFTYNEPTVWYEYMLDIAKLAKEKGLKTVVISSGFINQEPLKQLLPYIDAYKVDFKSINSQTYIELIRGRIEPVMETIKTIHKSKTWLELVHLLVPGYTDDPEEIKQLCEWIMTEVGPDVPVHFSRFQPMFKLLDLSPTPEKTVKLAREICLEAGLNYVYTGNIEDIEGSTTFCPDNHNPLLIRDGYLIKENRIDADGKAENCQTVIPGVWQKPAK